MRRAELISILFRHPAVIDDHSGPLSAQHAETGPSADAGGHVVDIVTTTESEW